MVSSKGANWIWRCSQLGCDFETSVDDPGAAEEAIRSHRRTKHPVIPITENTDAPPPPEFWSTGAVAGLFHVSVSFIRKKIESGEIRVFDRGAEWSHHRIRLEEVERLIGGLQLPRKSLIKISLLYGAGRRATDGAQGLRAQGELRTRLGERADELLSPYLRALEEKAERARAQEKRAVYEEVELLLDERTTVRHGLYVAGDGIWTSVSLDHCRLCGERMDLPLDATIRDSAKALRQHLLSAHPIGVDR